MQVAGDATHAQHPADAAQALHDDHRSHPLGHKLLWGGGIALAAFIALPYFGPLLAGMYGQAASISATTLCAQIDPAKAANMLAPRLAGLVSLLPGGAALAAGGWLTAGVALGIGLGGSLLANYLENRENRRDAAQPWRIKGDIRWSKVVRTLATATSIFISLPGLLSGITMSLNFLSSLSQGNGASGEALVDFAQSHHDTLVRAADFARAQIGTVGMEASGAGSAASLLSHAVSCGGPLLGAGLGQSIGNVLLAPKRFVDRVSERVDDRLGEAFSR